MLNLIIKVLKSGALWLAVFLVIVGLVVHQTKREKCQQIMKMGVGIVTAVGAAVAEKLSDDPEVGACFKKNLLNPSKCMKQDNAAEYEKAMAKGVEECLKMPDDLVDCLADMDIESEECEQAYLDFAGLVSAEPQREGPLPDWSKKLGGKVFDLALAPEQTVLVLLDESIVALQKGEIIWERKLEKPENWLLVLDSGCVLAGVELAVVCVDIKTGKLAWRAEIPDPDEFTSNNIVATSRAGTNAILLEEDGRFLKVDPDKCGNALEGCLIESGNLRRSGLDPLLWVMPDGVRVVIDYERMILTDSEGRPYARLKAEDSIGDVLIEKDGRLLFSFDKKLARLDPKKCKSEEYVPLPAGCVEVIDESKSEIDGYAPVKLVNGSIAIVGDNLVRLVGETPWKTDVGATSQVFSDADDNLYVACSGDDLKAKPEVRAISATDGKTIWRSKLPMPPVGFLDGPIMYADDDNLYVLYKQQVVALAKSVK
jgi:outer membrane protein assembly factor BamB